MHVVFLRFWLRPCSSNKLCVTFSLSVGVFRKLKLVLSYGVSLQRSFFPLSDRMKEENFWEGIKQRESVYKVEDLKEVYSCKNVQIWYKFLMAKLLSPFIDHSLVRFLGEVYKNGLSKIQQKQSAYNISQYNSEIV